MIKQKLSKSVKSGKLNVFLLFLLLSFSVLLFTRLSGRYSNELMIKIEPRNIPANRILQVDSFLQAKVSYSDYGFKILYHSVRDLEFPINLTEDASVINNFYKWNSNKNIKAVEDYLGITSEVISINPKIIAIPFDTLSTKKVPVNLKSKLDFESGYDALDAATVSPDSVEIIGAKSDIKNIVSISTEDFTLNSIDKNLDETIILKKPEKFQDIKLNPDNVNIRLTVAKFTEGEVEVPIITKNVPEDIEINYFPKSIKVVYYVSLENYSAISTSDFKIECDFKEGQQQNSSFFIPRLTIENSLVKSAKMKQDKVEYIIIQ